MEKVNWPDAAGICCQCFNPINEKEKYQVRPGGRKFHRHCYNQGGHYVQLENKISEREKKGGDLERF